jgi:hypothetical protein
MIDGLVQQFAAWLLGCSVELAPAEFRPWGDAMLAELRFIEGSWATLSWAVGGAGLFLKKTLISLLAGSGCGSHVPVATAGLDEEGAMKKLGPWVAGLSVAISLLMLLSPVLRQGLSVVAWGWRAECHLPSLSQREVQSLAAQARAEHDARTLAFLALQWVPNEEGSMLADEAVKMDPSLTWIYSPLADHTRENPETARWIEQLGRWDPDNAVPKLAAADRIYNEVAPQAPSGKLEATLAANRKWREGRSIPVASLRFIFRQDVRPRPRGHAPPRSEPADGGDDRPSPVWSSESREY